MLIDTEKDLQCRRQLDMEYGCQLYDINTILIINERAVKLYIDIHTFSVTMYATSAYMENMKVK